MKLASLMRKHRLYGSNYRFEVDHQVSGMANIGIQEWKKRMNWAKKHKYILKDTTDYQR